MAGALCSSILSQLLSQLGDKLLPAIKNSVFSPSSSFVEDELRRVRWTITRIRATLNDAEEREIRDHSVKLWLKELKKVAYDFEDILDESHYEVTRNQVRARDGNHAEVLFPTGMVDRIREIRERFDDIARERAALRLHEEDGVRRPEYGKYPFPTSHFVDKSSVFGRKEEKKIVVKLLLSDSYEENMVTPQNDEENKVSVICIVGKGGLGKTTLAQLVFNDHRFQQRFDASAWIHVSQDFDVERIMKALIESISGDGCSLTELSNLHNRLKKEIKDKTLFIVLDDVWNEQQSLWDLFLGPFKAAAQKVKILVTTRNNRVAQVMQTITPFGLEYLPENECLSLFRHHAFGSTNRTVNSCLVELGRQITEKCSGLPLAVKSLASLLKYESDENVWREILESDLWKLHSNNEIFAALQISYARLPANLKQCFLFCCMFPKRYCFEKGYLIRLWIAQGFVWSKEKKSMEEVGAECLEELSKRSLIDSNPDGFQLHDMMHELAQLISEKEYCSLDDTGCFDVPEVYHLYMRGFARMTKPLSSVKLRALRTLILHLDVEDSVDLDLVKAMSLRAFELRGKGAKLQLTVSVSSLKHLRCLDLSLCCFENLPESVCSLYNLRILSINKCSKIIELPEEIGNLVNLQYLHIGYTKIRCIPESLCFLSNLQTLNLTACDVDELPKGLGNLLDLRNLVLSDIRIQELPESVGQLNRLQNLVLDLESLRKLPYDVGNLTNLQIMDLSNSLNLLVPLGIQKLTALQRLNASLSVKVKNHDVAIGFLKDLVNIKGSLSIFGLQNMVSLMDAQNAILINKHDIRELTLSWPSSERAMPKARDKLILTIVEDDNGNFVVNGMDFLLLKCLQPHHNLTKFDIIGYTGKKFPRWMSDPLSCASLESISIEGCKNLRTLTFSNLLSLKSLSIVRCHGLQFLNKESLPSQLQVLCIRHCLQLKSLDMLPNYESTNQLYEVSSSRMQSKLMSLHIERCLQLESLVGIGSLTLLESLSITWCYQLCITPNEMLLSVPPNVHITYCPKLAEWCQQQNIEYSQ